jgi:hypothetical protein
MRTQKEVSGIRGRAHSVERFRLQGPVSSEHGVVPLGNCPTSYIMLLTEFTHLPSERQSV